VPPPSGDKGVRRVAESAQTLIRRAGLEHTGVLRVDDREQLRDILGRVAGNTRLEVLSALPGGPYSPRFLRGSWDQDLAVMARGVVLRAVYQADAARSPEVLRYLTEFAGHGAQVRVSARVRHRTIIVDREMVIVAVDEDSLTVPFLVVEEPAMVRSFQAQFAAMWKSAHSVGIGAEDSLGSETVQQTLDILKSGVTDEVAARRLGVSVRTIRRRVAAVMELLGAESRFEAGVKAVQAGWL
jgi:DNA-binding CsgD family transcriptional regulator